MAIPALVFDADGVLILPHRFADELERDYGLNRENTQDFFRGAFELCLIGQADLRVELAPFLRQWGWPHSLDDFIERWFKAENVPNQPLLAAIQSFRTAGLRCYVATNQERYRATYLREQMSFQTLFDGVFASADLGTKKPEARFYAGIEQAIGVSGQELVFWDDTLVNVTAARSVGWYAEQYTSISDFHNRMQQYL